MSYSGLSDWSKYDSWWEKHVAVQRSLHSYKISRFYLSLIDFLLILWIILVVEHREE